MRKITIALFFNLLYTGCSTVDDDRICLDWDSSIEVVEDCTPLYGNIICVVKEKPRYWCVLYEESEDEVLLNKS